MTSKSCWIVAKGKECLLCEDGILEFVELEDVMMGSRFSCVAAQALVRKLGGRIIKSINYGKNITEKEALAATFKGL